MAKTDLKIHQKRFIVRLLAQYESPTDVIAAVKEAFDVTVSRQQLQHYDPTTVNGADLKEDLKTLFHETRAEFERLEPVPLAKRVVRVKKLAAYVEKMENLGNYGKAAELLAQIAKEEGGIYTNRKEITGAGGGPVAIHSKTLDDWEKDAGARTNQAAAVLEMFEEDAPGN